MPNIEEGVRETHCQLPSLEHEQLWDIRVDPEIGNRELLFDLLSHFVAAPLKLGAKVRGIRVEVDNAVTARPMQKDNLTDGWVQSVLHLKVDLLLKELIHFVRSNLGDWAFRVQESPYDRIAEMSLIIAVQKDRAEAERVVRKEDELTLLSVFERVISWLLHYAFVSQIYDLKLDEIRIDDVIQCDSDKANSSQTSSKNLWF